VGANAVVVKYLVGGKCSANSVQSIVHSALCSQARFTTAAGHPTILLLTDPLHWCWLYHGHLLGGAAVSDCIGRCHLELHSQLLLHSSSV